MQNALIVENNVLVSNSYGGAGSNEIQMTSLLHCLLVYIAFL